MQLGLNLIGVLEGSTSKPWDLNGRSGITYKIRIAVGDRENDYGEVEKTYQEIRLSQEQFAQVQANLAKLSGKIVSVPVYANARGYEGRPPFVQFSLVRDAEILEYDSKSKAA